MVSKHTILSLILFIFVILPPLIVGQRLTFPPPTTRKFGDGPDKDYYVEASEYDYLNFSVIVDPAIRRYSQEFNILCPHTDLCDVKVYYNQSLFKYISFDLYEVACCGSCSCPRDTECMKTRDCCIDALPRLLTSEEVKAIHDDPAKCIYAQYRPYDVNKYNGQSYYLITKCSEDYHVEGVKEKCLRKYSDFDLVTEIPEYLPVTDNRTMTSYKNLFCGLCNHVPRSELIFWDTEVECNESIVLDETQRIRSLSDIEQFIARDNMCNLVFEEPYYLQFREPFILRCNAYIERCNVTGLWQNFDPELESLCTSYISSYKGYRNVHCYLCNGFEISTVEDICVESAPTWRPSSFVSLLDFNNLELSEKEDKSDSTETRVCPQGQTYDILARVCRPLLCQEFANLKEDKCQPIFDKSTYDVTVRLVPAVDIMDVRLIPALQDLIADDIKRRLSYITSPRGILCEIQTFIKLNEKLEPFQERVSGASFANVSFAENITYVAMRVLVAVTDDPDVILSIEKITHVLYGQTFNNIPGFQIVFADIDFNLFEQRNQFSNALRGQPLNPYSLYNFIEAYQDHEDGQAILPVQPKIDTTCSNRNRLLPFNFCPLIELSEHEFRLENDMLFLNNVGSYVNLSDVVFSRNGSRITLCSIKYFSNDFHRKLQGDNPYEAEFIVSVICTSISLLSLFVVFVTYCCFKTLRTLPGLNIMALVLSIFFAQLLYVLGGAIEIKINWLCEVLGLLLHFTIVASFCWMGVCTFHMMRVFVFISKRSETENSVTRPFIRYIAIATLGAAVMICINIIVSVTSDDTGFGYGGQPCYITDKGMILYTVAIPLGIIVTCNFLMFIYVIVKVTSLPDVKKNTKKERRNIVIFAKLSTLTGLTWIFAFIYQWAAVKVFAYLFIITNASQGLFIMFSFVINKRVCGMVNTSLKKSSLYKSGTRKTFETSPGKS